MSIHSLLLLSHDPETMESDSSQQPAGVIRLTTTDL